MDRNQPDHLVRVRQTAVHGPWLRLEGRAGPAMGESEAAGDHCSSPACVRDRLAISPRGGGLIQRWPLPRASTPPGFSASKDFARKKSCRDRRALAYSSLMSANGTLPMTASMRSAG